MKYTQNMDLYHCYSFMAPHELTRGKNEITGLCHTTFYWRIIDTEWTNANSASVIITLYISLV